MASAIGDICRACMLKSCLSVDMFYAVEQDGLSEQTFTTHVTFADMFSVICAPLKVSNDDNLPLKLCYECMAKLKNAFDFRNKCQEVDNTLRTSFITDENYSELMEDNDPISNDLGDIHDTRDQDNHGSDVLKNEEETISEESTDNKFVCEHCKKKYQRLDLLKAHLKRYHKLIFKCNACFKLFLNNDQLTEHVKIHGDMSKMLKCAKCPKVFKTNDLLMRHDITHTLDTMNSVEKDGEKYPCDDCDEVFNTKPSLYSHKRVHRKIDKTSIVSCTVCNKTMQFINLARHMLSHTNVKPYKCDKCDGEFTRREFLVDHIHTRHNKALPDPLVPPVNACRFCNKVFETRRLKRAHLLTHSGEMPFLCSQCGKSCLNKSSLDEHLTIHTHLKPFKCHLCPKQFRTRTMLANHIKIHKGTSLKYSCEICKRGCRNAYRLRVHMQLHTGTKQFDCDLCNSSFYSDDQLMKHRKSHTGEISYSCTHCGESFPSYKNMYSHVKKKHLGKNVYECTICNERFRLLRELTKHYPSHYVDEEHTQAKAASPVPSEESDDSLYENLEVLDEAIKDEYAYEV